MAEPVPARPAATLLLIRDAPELQVLLVKRHHQVDFIAGALVFPGGKIHAGDHDPAWGEHAIGWAPLSPEQRSLRIAAVREAYEEAGVLVAKDRSGAAFRGAAEAHDAREAVARDERSFLDLVRELDVSIDLSALELFARWITPDMSPKRFDTWFYIARADSEQLAVCDGMETVDAEWMTPSRALSLAAAGLRKVVFPTRMNLQLLGESASAEEAMARAAARPMVTVEGKLVERESGAVLVIPPDAGYGAVEQPLASLES